MYIDIHASVNSPDEFASLMTETEAQAKAHAHIERMDNGRLYQVDIFMQPRIPLDAPEYKHPGWLEWLLVYRWEGSDSKLTVGMIQRQPGAEFEFHS